VESPAHSSLSFGLACQLRANTTLLAPAVLLRAGRVEKDFRFQQLSLTKTVFNFNIGWPKRNDFPVALGDRHPKARVDPVDLA
jgi:hypothetical protein